MLSSKTLKEIVTEARPIIEQQIDAAVQIAAFRDVVANAGGDWSALKALIKAQILDERDETSQGKRVKKILEKAGFSTDYAGLLGWSNMNEKNFSADEEFDPITGEFIDGTPSDARPASVPTVTRPLGDSEGEADPSLPDNSPETAMRFQTKPEEVAVAKGAATVEAGSSINEELDRQPASAMGLTDDGRQGAREQSANASIPAFEAPEGNNGLPLSGNDGAPDRLAANAGGDHEVTGLVNTAAQAGAEVSSAPANSLRPYCLRPQNCGGYGDKTCHSCTVAARKSGEAA